MYRTNFIADITPEMEQKEIVVAGWIHNIRDLGAKKFILLRDATGIGQVIIERNTKAFEASNDLSLESAVQIRGIVKSDKRAPRGVEVHAEDIVVLSKAKSPLPLDVYGKVKADIDTRLRERLLDLRREEMQAVIRIESEAVRSFRENLYKNRFVEIFTPKIIATATEGGAQLFPVIYFGKEAFLAQSPQLYKELLAGAVERVFEIGPAWRAEDSDTPYHLSEFISADIEMAFADYNDVMGIVEDTIITMANKLKEKCSAELETLNYRLPDISKPIKRITYTEAIETLQSLGVKIKFGDDLATPELRTLNEHLKTDLYFVIDWPAEARPFYTKRKDNKPEISESFDLIFRWLELASGSSRNFRREVLENELRVRGLNTYNFEYFLKWFDYGMPPHAGVGIGLQRLMLMFTGLQNVKEISLFPRDKKRLVP
ncbi:MULTISPECIES: aspartate--tRNA(Asn) ligase [Acidianus]|uniref:Aspartate--tRNA(Asp/Asn) ligase n=1 Tax=Candidatus Acidianus copahuensis TaxID=1160895 RepID=A0A031LNX1_9CREN|nr:MULTISPECIES: aspartate--tRNA(Asn) ligase [Acidianus]EZQ03789.1 aspartate--tRNA ligase [Candidatus Acidianus copahuensis]NON62703.1 aspartate--tRNA(Asn) ligase [Acidianus sp. RZ1]